MAEITAKLKKWFESSSKKQKLIVSLLAFSLLATGVLLSLGDSTNTARDPIGSSPFYFLSAFIKLMAVLLLVVGSSVIFRRWVQPGLHGKKVQQMQMLETIRLSPKQALHLVLIGDQKLLIGATDQNVSLIAPIHDHPVPVQESPSQSGLDFESMIQSFDLDYSSENPIEMNKP